MPTFRITGPDGKAYNVTAPEGATEQQAFANFKMAMGTKQADENYDPTSGMSTTDKVLAGIGKSMVDTGRGVGQFVGLTSRQDVADSRKRDKALMDTTAGTVGNVGADIATGALSMLIPGANTVKGASLVGGAFGASRPSESTQETLLNTGLGAGGAALGQWGGNKIAQSLQPRVIDPGVRAGVSAAREAGYVVPPTQANPTMMNRALEGLAGKISTAQNASAKNQGVTNELAKKAIGADALSVEGLQAVRNTANQAYDELGKFGAFYADDGFRTALDKVGSGTSQFKKDFPQLANKEVDALVESLKNTTKFDSQSAIEAIKTLRFEGSANKVAMEPGKKALGQAQMKIAKEMEDLVDRNLQFSDATDLLKNYRDARTTLAKVYDVEKALNKTTGNIDAAKLAKLMDKRPLTGELKTIGDFAKQFPKAAQVTEKMGSLPQVSPLDFGAAAGISAATSNPLMMAGMFARPAARAAVLSPMVQNGLLSQGGGKMAGLLSSEYGKTLPPGLLMLLANAGQQ